MDNQTVAQPGTVTQARVKQLLHYDPETGIFRYKQKRGRERVGDVAGTVTSDGYVAITIDRMTFQAHRLAFLYMTGAFPKDCVDHVDRRRDNNSWANLRPATAQENRQNQARRADNTSGYPGVTWDQSKQRWMARIYHEGKDYFLGRFRTAAEAFKAYSSAKAKIHIFHPEAVR